MIALIERLDEGSAKVGREVGHDIEAVGVERELAEKAAEHLPRAESTHAYARVHHETCTMHTCT